MNVGFTGTREGMTAAQFDAFVSLIEPLTIEIFRHGCCVGADEQAALHVHDRSPRPVIFGHLGDTGGLTSGRAVEVCDDTAAPEPPLNRNIDIVRACDVLIACPKGPEEQRSGTWFTVRYARKQEKRIVIVWPDGEITREDKL